MHAHGVHIRQIARGARPAVGHAEADEGVRRGIAARDRAVEPRRRARHQRRAIVDDGGRRSREVDLEHARAGESRGNRRGQLRQAILIVLHSSQVPAVGVTNRTPR